MITNARANFYVFCDVCSAYGWFLPAVDVVVKIADHSETSDNMGQGMAEREPGNVANGVKNLFDL
jgi:hypothetical protein